MLSDNTPKPHSRPAFENMAPNCTPSKRVKTTKKAITQGELIAFCDMYAPTPNLNDHNLDGTPMIHHWIADYAALCVEPAGGHHCSKPVLDLPVDVLALITSFVGKEYRDVEPLFHSYFKTACAVLQARQPDKLPEMVCFVVHDQPNRRRGVLVYTTLERRPAGADAWMNLECECGALVRSQLANFFDVDNILFAEYAARAAPRLAGDFRTPFLPVARTFGTADRSAKR